MFFVVESFVSEVLHFVDNASMLHLVERASIWNFSFEILNKPFFCGDWLKLFIYLRRLSALNLECIYFGGFLF